MRTLICEWLEAAGYQVRSFARFDASPGKTPDARVGLVVLELPQPRTDVAGMARRVQQVREVYRDSAIVGISTQAAHTLRRDAAASRALDVEGLLAKPCSRQELLGAVTALC